MLYPQHDSALPLVLRCKLGYAMYTMTKPCQLHPGIGCKTNQQDKVELVAAQTVDHQVSTMHA